MSRVPPREVRVAPNIYKTEYGWRVYVRRRSPKTGKSAKRRFRFKPHVTLEELEHFRDSYQLESKRLRREARKAATVARWEHAGMFVQDAATYLALKTTKAMPSYKDRKRDIELWAAAFRTRLRAAIAAREIDQQLQGWIDEGYAASTVNNRRTALMAMWTALDGRGAANPVRDSQIFEEPELEPRGLPFHLVDYILDAIPAVRSHSHLRPTKLKHLKTKPRVVLEALTGMRPSQIGRLERGKHFSVKERWYVIPRSDKGKQRRKPRTPRPSTRKLMTERQAIAFQRFDELDCYGTYSASSRRRIFNEAVKVATIEIRKAINDPTFSFPKDLVPKDLRHSFGTEMLRVTKNQETVAELLDQSTTRHVRRYALGAIPEILAEAAKQFEAANARTVAAPDETPRPPRAPRRRGARSGRTGQPLTH